jgi:membrane fusion protein, multidrug efflux system
VSLFVPDSRVLGSLAALFAALATSVCLVGCNRHPAPPVTNTAKSAGTAATDRGDAATNATAATPGPSAPGARKAGEMEKDKARQAAADTVPVETAPVIRGPISAFLAFNSTLETESVVDIYPQTGGQVEALLVEEGRIVKEGDPLLKIDDRELRVDVEESAANFEHLEKNFARNEDLFKRNLINKQDYETQAYQLEQARLRLERAKIRLSYATVRAPFAGVISARETQVGARVGNGTKLFSMVKLDDIVARVFVPGRYLPIVAENQPAIVTSEFLPDRTFQGWVKRISPVIDPKSGTFKVTVGVRSEKSSDLPPGLFVGVRVITDTRQDAVLIPKRAVVYEGGERYAFLVVNGRAVKRKLVAGYEDPENIEVKSGFEVGASVIVLGQNGLKDGAPIREVNALAPFALPPLVGEANPETPPKAPAKTADVSVKS